MEFAFGFLVKIPSNYFKSIHAVICIVFPHRKTKEIAGTSPRGHVELKEIKKLQVCDYR